MITVVIILSSMLCNFFAARAFSQEQIFIPYQLQAGSRLWIDGTATLGSYRCGTVAVYGTGGLNASMAQLKELPHLPKIDSERVRILIVIRMLDCGNPAMNHDMYRSLRADQDSTIRFILTEAQIQYDSLKESGWLGLRTIGELSIAGVTRTDTVDVRVKILSEREYEIIGQKKISMLDFNITPPTAFFGLIKANENLIVNFDFIAGPNGNFAERQNEHPRHKL